MGGVFFVRNGRGTPWVVTGNLDVDLAQDLLQFSVSVKEIVGLASWASQHAVLPLSEIGHARSARDVAIFALFYRGATYFVTALTYRHLLDFSFRHFFVC